VNDMLDEVHELLRQLDRRKDGEQHEERNQSHQSSVTQRMEAVNANPGARFYRYSLRYGPTPWIQISSR
jgi:hypothetical protein